MSSDRQNARGIEFWMISNLAAGAATTAFLNVLVSPFILQTTGSALRSGIVLALIGLVAVTGPLWGKLADKHHAHRLIYLLSLVGLVVSFLLLAFDAGLDWYSPIFGILCGLSIAAQGTIGPAFIIGAGLPEKIVSRQLTTFNLAYPLGQVLGAAAVALCQLVGLDFTGLFVMATILLLAFTVCTFFSINKPAVRLKSAMEKASARSITQQKPKVIKHKGSFRSAIFSVFGIFLLVVISSSFSNNGMTSQIANIMPNVYGFTAVETSALISVAGLLNLLTIVVFGKVMERIGAKKVYIIGTAVRFVGVSMMALVGMIAQDNIFLLASIAVQIALQGSPISRLPAPVLAAQLAPVGAAEANGYYYGASAFGAFAGCLVAGFIADSGGFNAVSWMATIAGGVALLVLCLWLIPLIRHTKTKQ